MYAYLRGTVEELYADSLALDVNGVGYQVIVSSALIQSLVRGSQVKLYTYYQVREDAHVLYGFLSQAQKTMFLRLISVSGIGPKLGMAVMSHLTISDLALALVTGDVTALSRVPGVGKKTAQRLILELKEKVDNSELASGEYAVSSAPVGNAAAEAVTALMALGINSADAQKAVRSLAGEYTLVEDIIRAVLKQMDARR